MNNKLILLITAFMWIKGYAQTTPSFEENIKVAQVELDTTIFPPSQTIEASPTTYHIDTETLENNPILIAMFINQAIEQKKEYLLPELLVMYQKYENTDPILIKFAQGIYAYSQQDYSQAIYLYRQLLAENPNLIKVRFKLAQWLFEDKQFHAAQDQFQKLKSENLPYFVQYQIQQYLLSIQKQTDWKINFGLSYLQDNNINNASSEPYIQIGNLRFTKNENSLPQKGQGLNYHVNLNKLFPLYQNHFLSLENQLQGKYYWNNKDYNELENQLYLGYQYQDAMYKFAILPVYKKNWFNNKQYSQTYGIRLEGSKWLSPRWYLSSAIEFNHINYQRKNDSKRHQIYSNTLMYIPNAKQVFYTGIDFLLERSSQYIEQYNRYILRLGWQQEWSYGLSTHLNLQFGQRIFYGVDPLLRKQRRDKDIRTNITLWKRDLYWFNFTPKLQFRYQRVNSSIHEFYSYDKSQLVLLMESNF